MKKILFLPLLLLIAHPITAQTWSWATNIGVFDNETAQAVAADKFGNVVFSGHYIASQAIASLILPGGSQTVGNAVIAKYDSFGVGLWSQAGVADPNVAWAPWQTDIGCDGAGNVYAFGNFTSEITWGGQVLDNPICSNHCYSPYLVSFDPSGNLRWAKVLQNSPYSWAYGLDVTENGDVYICGSFSQSIKIGSTTLSTIGGGGQDGYLAKYDSSGTNQWVMQTGKNIYSTQNFDVACAGANAVYVSGTFQDSAQFGNQWIYGNNTPLTRNPFVAKYDAAGNFQWVKGGTGQMEGNITGIRLATAGDHRVYLAGMVPDTLYAPPVSVFNTTGKSFSDYLLAMDSSGTFEWGIAAGGKPSTQGWEPCVAAAHTGEAYLFSSFSDTATVGSDTLYANGILDMYFAQIDTLGNVNWVEKMGASGQEIARGVAVDGQDNVFIVGRNTSGFALGSTSVSNAGGGDMFIARWGAPFVPATRTENTPVRVSIYPNPASDFLVVDLLDERMALEILDGTGKRMLEDSFSGQKRLDLAGWNTGLYFVIIKDEKGNRFPSKLIVQ